MSIRDNDNGDERKEAAEKIRQGLADVEAGRTSPAAQVFEELRRKFNIPRSDGTRAQDRSPGDG
jgi:hypothetical protein